MSKFTPPNRLQQYAGRMTKNETAIGLAALEARLLQDLERLNLPPVAWTPERTDADGESIADVVVVGAGMCGLAAAFALRCLGVDRIRHLDRREAGFEGPWLNYARMRTLRSPKHLTGPVLGIASLTFRAWYEALHGASAWESLEKIETATWMNYLRWFAKVSSARVENRVSVTTLNPAQDHVALEVRNANNHVETMLARQVVLATGREGQAIPRMPPALESLAGSQLYHSSALFDFSELKSQEVAIVGIAASAFDNAATALEAGAKRVTMLGRAATLPTVNKMKQTVYPGFTWGYPDLPDADKLSIMRYVANSRIAPPRASVLRLSSDPRFRLLLDASIENAKQQGNRLQLQLKHASLLVDHIIYATGFALDLGSTPELATIESNILRWHHRVTEESPDEWSEAPYLGDGFEFLPRQTEKTPGLSRIRCFTHTAQLSLGNLANDIPAVSEGAHRLATSVASSLFVEDREYHRNRLEAYEEPELLGDEWPADKPQS